MTYPDYNTSITDDISNRKEYAIFTDVNLSKQPTTIDALKEKENILELNTYQQFIKNYFNPNTKYNRLFLIHGTGTGKTITSLSAIYEFIQFSRKTEYDNLLNHVIVVGFTKNIFKRELLTYSEFGFLSKEEIQEFLYTEEQAKRDNPDAMKYLNELKIKYSRRLFNRNIGGIFKFYGYKELLMKLLDFSRILKKGIKLSNVKGTDIREYIKNGDVVVNESVMKIFAHSLIVCDEVHNVYNSFYTNNWGTILELIMDYYNDPKKKEIDPKYNSVRIMYLSATPISNSPIELVSIINLLNNEEDRVKIEDIFDTNGQILSSSLPKVHSSLYGKISYVMDNNPSDYPSSSFIGESIQHIHYLKFIRCPMTPFHKKTYIKLSNDQLEGKDSINVYHANDTSSEYSESILITKEMRKYPVNLALHNRYLNDYVLPNPKDKNHGIFLSSDIEHIHTAPKKWKDEYGIYTEIDSFNQYIFNGPFLLENNIKNISTKFYKLLILLKDIILHRHGKIFIYHHFVNNSGVMFIQSLLRENGFLMNDEEPISSSTCMKCYHSLQEHKKIKNHNFIPIRFTVITGNLTKSQVYKNLDTFNSTSNIDGSSLKIVLGSKAIKESYNIKGIQHVLITHSPDNISDLIQVIGRAIRKKSHIDLPIEQRKTSIYILVSSLEKNIEKKYHYTFEEARYKSKVNIYKSIQQIENIFYDLSVDYLINFMINKREVPKLIGKAFYMDNDRYKAFKKRIYSKSLNTSTFYAYFLEDEINMIQSIIKRLFIEYQTVFTYEDLFFYIRHPPFNVNMNTVLFSESSFILAIDALLYQKNNIHTLKKENILMTRSNAIVDSLYNKITSTFIGFDGIKYTIMNHNNLFMRVPYQKDTDTIDTSIDASFRETIIPSVKNIHLDELIQKNKIVYQFDSILEECMELYHQNKLQLSSIIETYSFQFNLFLVEHSIQQVIECIITSKKIDDTALTFYMNMLHIYRSMHYVFTYDMITNKDYFYYNQEYIQKNKSNNITSAITIDTLYQNKKNKKIDSGIIPIGHFLKNKPTLYDIQNKKWITIPTIFKKIQYINNPKITGYDIKMEDSMIIDFKMQVQRGKGDKKNKDTEGTKGIVCTFNSKTTLKEVCKLLDINLEQNHGNLLKKNTICSIIREKLIELEEKERKKQSNIKYFYNFYEHIL